MKYHLIAIGGSVMHNMAISLHQLGHEITGSDDQIYDPARTRLQTLGLLPAEIGWNPDRIHTGLDAVILGMHAKKDNPELMRAQQLGVKVFSFPEFVYEHSQDKQRVVIAGSHGKTTITSMVMHVLRSLGRDFDYLVGAQLEGFDAMVRLSDTAPIVIVEGDEYLASPLDPRPKFLVYKPHLVLISGIAWDHINVFPTEEEYNQQFMLLVKSIAKAGMIVYNDEDKLLRSIVKENADPEDHYLYPYRTPDHRIKDNRYEIKLEGLRIPVEVIGKHNILNIAGAWNVCKLLAVDAEDFLRHISTFKGAAKRLEKVYEDENNIIFKDFAHSPSKVMATVDAIREMFSRWNIVACLELHTFSSLNKKFLHQYRKTLKTIRKKVIFINEQTLKQKNYPPISKKELVDAFEDEQIEYATSLSDLKNAMAGMKDGKNVFLMMSSGNFDNWDLLELVKGGH